MTTVLVAYATRRGSTKEIAEWVGDALREAGHTVDVRPAGDVRDIVGYDAVVLGSALYMQRWCRDARWFARRHRRALAGRPVWLFSSGPLDHTADGGGLPPVRGVRRLAERFGAEAVTFGGALDAGTQGWDAACRPPDVRGVICQHTIGGTTARGGERPVPAAVRRPVRGPERPGDPCHTPLRAPYTADHAGAVDPP